MASTNKTTCVQSDYKSGKKESNNFTLCQEEAQKLGEMLRDDKFRQLLMEYAEEITDPNNRKQYEEEIVALEKERGQDVTFIHPEAGYVLKTRILEGNQKSGTKAFINIGKNANVAAPVRVPADDAISPSGSHWSVPYLLNPPREDVDKACQQCLVYDALFHPDTLCTAQKSVRFRLMIEGITLDGIEEKFQVKLDRKNVRYPKLKFKGRPVATVTRAKPKDGSSLKDDVNNETSFLDTEKYVMDKITSIKENGCDTIIDNSRTAVIPKYAIKYSHSVSMQDFCNVPGMTCHSTRPHQVVISIMLPGLSSVADAQLDVSKKKLTLKASSSVASYALQLDLAYPVDEDSGTAKYDRSRQELVITLPVDGTSYGNASFLSNTNCSTEYDQPLTDIGLDNKSGKEEAPNTSERHALFENNNDAIFTTSSDPAKPKDMYDSHEPVQDKIEVSGTPVDEDTCEVTVQHKCPANPLCIPTVAYHFAEFQHNQTEEHLALVIPLPNVDPDSTHSYICDCHRYFQLTFTTLGSGFVPYHYSLCVRLNSEVSLDPLDVKVDVGNQNTVLRLGKGSKCRSFWDQFYAGVDEKHLKLFEFTLGPSILQHLEILQNETKEFLASCKPLDGANVIVSDVTANMVSLDIQLTKSASGDSRHLSQTLNMEESDQSDVTTKGIAETLEGRRIRSNKILEENRIGKLKMPFKTRTSSESSEDQSPFRRNRGILKHLNGWNRTISESSDDVGNWSSQEASPTETVGFPLKEDSGESDKPKKSVRFSDNVSRNVFRPNSSILGQRKKNQKKALNKRKAAARRDSESGEAETTDTPQSGYSSSSEVEGSADSCLEGRCKSSHTNYPAESCNGIKIQGSNSEEKDDTIILENGVPYIDHRRTLEPPCDCIAVDGLVLPKENSESKKHNIKKRHRRKKTKKNFVLLQEKVESSDSATSGRSPSPEDTSKCDFRTWNVKEDGSRTEVPLINSLSPENSSCLHEPQPSQERGVQSLGVIDTKDKINLINSVMFQLD